MPHEGLSEEPPKFFAFTIQQPEPQHDARKRGETLDQVVVLTENFGSQGCLGFRRTLVLSHLSVGRWDDGPRRDRRVPDGTRMDKRWVQLDVDPDVTYPRSRYPAWLDDLCEEVTPTDQQSW